MPVFVETAKRLWQETSLQCAAFSVGDAVLTGVIYSVAIAATRRMRSARGLKFYFVVSALGVIAAVFIELIAKTMGYRTYSERMPIVFSLGLLPILQLATLAPLSVWICVEMEGNEMNTKQVVLIVLAVLGGLVSLWVPGYVANALDDDEWRHDGLDGLSCLLFAATSTVGCDGHGSRNHSAASNEMRSHD